VISIVRIACAASISIAASAKAEQVRTAETGKMVRNLGLWALILEPVGVGENT